MYSPAWTAFSLFCCCFNYNVNGLSATWTGVILSVCAAGRTACVSAHIVATGVTEHTIHKGCTTVLNLHSGAAGGVVVIAAVMTAVLVESLLTTAGCHRNAHYSKHCRCRCNFDDFFHWI